MTSWNEFWYSGGDSTPKTNVDLSLNESLNSSEEVELPRTVVISMTCLMT